MKRRRGQRGRLAGRAAGGAAIQAAFAPSRRRRFWTKIFYGTGSLAFGVKDNGFSVLLLLYYNQVLGLPAGLAGAAVALALVVDSMLDPVVGYLSDNLRSPWGRRHPFMYASAIPVALSYLVLWNPPHGLSTPALTAYLFVAAVLVRSFITLYEIPSSALGPELTGDYDERTSYMSYRYLFGWVGGVTTYILAFAVFLRPDAAHPVGQLNPRGYHSYALAASAVMFLSIIISSIGTHGAIPALKKPPPRRRLSVPTALREILASLGNPSAVALLLAGLLGGLTAGVAFALTTYFNTYFWRLSSGQIALLGLSSYLAATFAMTTAPGLARRLDKKNAAILIALVSIVLAPLAFGLRFLGMLPSNGSPALVAVLFVFSSITVGLAIIPPILISSMISDVVEDNQVKTGRRSEGVLFAANAFLQKCVSGLGLAGAGVILSLVHFPQKAAPDHVPAATLNGLVFMYLLVLTTVNLLSVLAVSRYRITRALHQANLQSLAAAAAEASGEASAGAARTR